MPLYDTSYQHWQGHHLGLWRRRGVIAANGLRATLQIKWCRHLVVLCWGFALAQTAILFIIGQLLVKDSLVVRWLGSLNISERSFAIAFTSWLELHPEISVRCTENVLFYFFSSWLVPPTLIVIALAIPHLITRDLSSQAITIYASKAVGRFDYLLGKWGALMGLMTLCWLGPICASWFLGNLLAPHWHFFWHARVALGHTLLYVVSGMCIVGVIALGVSAVSSREKATVALWFMLWILGQSMVPIAKQTKPWLEHFSFTANLHELGLSVFQLKKDLVLAQENIPVFGALLPHAHNPVMAAIQNPDFWGAAAGFSVMLVLAAGIIYWRVKPE